MGNRETHSFSGGAALLAFHEKPEICICKGYISLFGVGHCGGDIAPGMTCDHSHIPPPRPPPQGGHVTNMSHATHKRCCVCHSQTSALKPACDPVLRRGDPESHMSRLVQLPDGQPGSQSASAD